VAPKLKMLHNGGMREMIRLACSLLWFPATGAVFATGLLFILTWGGYFEFLLASALAWALTTGITVLTTFD
jgi:hypothetical protein